jgi:parvulin-like peptidyl-prolyl isomerase
MTRFGSALFLGCLLAWLTFEAVEGCADELLGPGDPIAAIDGEPVYLGELNLILTQRLKARDLEKLPIEVQQATAALLVRRHLAMKSLEQQGSDLLEAMIRRQVDLQAAEARRRGSNLEERARASMADEKSLIADIAWRTAWKQYLKSRLTDTNLRRYFAQHRDRYAGSRWEVSQIFVEADTSDAQAVKAAQANLSELADQLRSSGSIAEAFAEAARQHSDSGSAAAGGMIGWVEKDGDLPRDVMNVIRKTRVGSISDPVRSALGMHLVYVHRCEPGDLEFDDLTDQAQLRRDAADALFDALLAQQKDAKVVWFIKALEPPQGVRLVPE